MTDSISDYPDPNNRKAWLAFLDSLKTWYCPFVDAWFDPMGARMVPVREKTVYSSTISATTLMALGTPDPYHPTQYYQPILDW